MVLESRVLELTRENTILKAELHAIKEKFCLPLNQHFVDPELLSITMPENGSRGRRNKLLNSLINGNYNCQCLMLIVHFFFFCLCNFRACFFSISEPH